MIPVCIYTTNNCLSLKHWTHRTCLASLELLRFNLVTRTRIMFSRNTKLAYGREKTNWLLVWTSLFYVLKYIHFASCVWFWLKNNYEKSDLFWLITLKFSNTAKLIDWLIENVPVFLVINRLYILHTYCNVR